MKAFFLSLLILPMLLIGIPQYEVCICAIFQNEADYLKEWIDYHQKVGVQHFWLYNNNSTDHYAKILKPYIKKGIVELIEWPSVQEENDWKHFSFGTQTDAYCDALNRCKGLTKWLAIIDTDEFIFPVCEKRIQDVMEKHFRHVSGLCINWQCYGTSNVEKCKSGQMLKKLVWKFPWDHPRNLYFKSIVQPEHTTECRNPHYCHFLPQHWHINPNGDRIHNQNTGIFIDKIRINHYWARDEWFLRNVKVPRYQRWGGNADHILKEAAEMNQVYDDGIFLNLHE